LTNAKGNYSLKRKQEKAAESSVYIKIDELVKSLKFDFYSL